MATDITFAAAGAAASMSLSDVDYGKVGKKEGSQFTFAGMFTLLLAGGGATFSVLSMLIEASKLTILAGLVTLAVTPIVLVQRFQLSRMSTFREVHNALRQDVMRISSENDDLERQTTRLQEKADRVKIVEGNLQTLATQSGATADSLVLMVKENGIVLEEMEKIVKAQVAQQLMTIVVGVDRDQNFQLSDQEVDELILRARGIKGVEGVDETKFRQTLKNSNGIEGVFQLIRDMQAKKNTGTVTVSSRGLLL